MKNYYLEKLLYREIVKAMGCTEPAAIAYASAETANLIKKKNNFINEIETVEIILDKAIFKNAFSVGLPNTNGLNGIKLAASLGLFLEPYDKLNLLHKIDKKILSEAKKIENKISIKINNLKKNIYVNVIIKTRKHKLQTIIKDAHTNIVLLKKDGEIIYQQSKEKKSDKININNIKKYTLEDFLKFIQNMDNGLKKYIYSGIQINKKAAVKGLKRKKSSSIFHIHGQKNPTFRAISKGQGYAYSACNLRMKGYPIEIMTAFGSGNQGIMCTLPILAISEEFGNNKEKLISSVTLAYLITAYITAMIGYLTPVCGCIAKAGIGAAAGIAYYLKNDITAVENAINNMSASVVGTICDGAKPGCALKLFSAASAAYISAFLAIDHLSGAASSGIIGDTWKETINNLKIISDSMKIIDNNMVDILRRKLEKHI